MKVIDIYVEGKYYYKFQISTWCYYMSYKKAVIKRTGQVNGQGSPARSTLLALYKALDKIKEPCILRVYSKIPLGFKTPKKSPNKDLLINIITAITKAGHIVSFEVDSEFYKPTMWEQLYGTPINGSTRKEDTKSKDYKIQTKTAIHNIENKTKHNEVFSNTESEEDKIKREWEELLNDDKGAWVAGSGGY